MMMVFACRIWQGFVTPQENQKIAWSFARLKKLRDAASRPADHSGA